MEASTKSEDLAATVRGIDREDAAFGFDVVRLSFDERFAGRRNLGKAAWLDTVRWALDDISDEILLLGCFSEVRVEDLSW